MIKLGSNSKILPIVALSLGFLLVLAYIIRLAPNSIKSLTLSVTHPTTYRFETYGAVLQKYVKDGLVDYAAMKSDPDLGKAVSELESIAPDKLENDNEKACFWINACNLLTLKVINDHYPVTSSEKLTQFWSQNSFIVGGQSTSVTKALGRATNALKDNRMAANTIFLICRGTLGYPPLTEHVITPESMESDAKVATYKFVNNEHNVYYDDERLEFLLSPLFKKYETYLQRANVDPHHFALLQLNSTNPPDLTNLMITKTYFRKLDPTINDTALAPKKGQE